MILSQSIEEGNRKTARLAVLGLGFMGASLAAAWKRFALGKVSAFDPVPARVSWALAAGVIDRGADSVAAAVQDADLVVSAAPVDRIVGNLVEAAAHAPPGAIFTDLGSTRSEIDGRLKTSLPQGVGHAGSHPLAGSEKSGPQQCNDILFVGKRVLVTPVTATGEQLARLTNWWEALGARVDTIDSLEHDRILAQTSHLPHLVAFVLARSLPGEWKEFTATGFRDTTRIAAGSPEIWGPIFQTNRSMLLEAMDRFEREWAQWRQTVEAGDVEGLGQSIKGANAARKALE